MRAKDISNLSNHELELEIQAHSLMISELLEALRNYKADLQELKLQLSLNQLTMEPSNDL